MNKYQLKTLRNGLRLILVPRKGVNSATVEFSVAAGSRYETEKNNGISHFAEHLFFKGTQQRPTAHALAAEVDGLGAEMNAGTGKEETSFYIKASAKHLPQALDILSDILTHSKFDPREIEKERGVILEELNMYEDMPMKKIGEIFDSLLYSPTPLGREIIGKKENIRAIQRHDFLDYIRRFYQPARMVVSIAGDCAGFAKIAIRVLNAFFAKPKPLPPEVRGGKHYSFSQTKPQVKIYYKKTEQAHFCLGVRAFPRVHPDRYILSVLAVVLGGSMSSRLFEEVREKRGLAYYVKTWPERFYETGHLVTQSGTDLNKISEAVKVILNEYQKIASSKKAVGAVELRKAKEYLKGRLILTLEDSHQTASLYGESELLENKVRTPKEILSQIDQVTASDLTRVAKKIFLKKNLNLALIGPYKREEVFEKILTNFGN